LSFISAQTPSTIPQSANLFNISAHMTFDRKYYNN